MTSLSFRKATRRSCHVYLTGECERAIDPFTGMAPPQDRPMLYLGTVRKGLFWKNATKKKRLVLA
jgi:hypothetical protein